MGKRINPNNMLIIENQVLEVDTLLNKLLIVYV